MARPRPVEGTALDFARRELAAGVREATNRNDGVPLERYMDGLIVAPGLGAPWCAGFVRWCFEASGRPLPGRRDLLVSVAFLEAELDKAGARIAGPEVGAIVTFRWRVGSDRGPGRHVEIVEAVDKRTITTIGGNSGDRVKRNVFSRTSPAITGFFRWPAR